MNGLLRSHRKLLLLVLFIALAPVWTTRPLPTQAAPVQDASQELIENTFAIGVTNENDPTNIDAEGQTFTPTKTGKLTQIDVHVGFRNASNFPSGTDFNAVFQGLSDAKVDVLEWNGFGDPPGVGDAIASGTIAKSTMTVSHETVEPAWHSVTLSPQPIVTAGQTYVFIVHALGRTDGEIGCCYNISVNFISPSNPDEDYTGGRRVVANLSFTSQGTFPTVPTYSITAYEWGTGEGDLAFRTYIDQGGDSDEDGVKDFVDNCPDVKNANQADFNDDDEGDACDDSDDDEVVDATDNCRDVKNTDQANLDAGEEAEGAKQGDACDTDDDNDGDLDTADNCPRNKNADQANHDNDSLGDVCDPDDDNDEDLDGADNCPLVPNADQKDSDEDGTGDACDDSDGDTIPDLTDQCDPSGPRATSREDFDGIDDGDGCFDFDSRLEVRKQLLTGSGTFDLRIDGTIYGSGGNGATTGDRIVGARLHTVAETGEDVSDFVSVITCRLNGGLGSIVANGPGPSLEVNVPALSNVLCLIKNTERQAGCGDMVFDNIIFGNNNGNVLIGTAGRDLIQGYGGNDYVEGQGGNDCILAGEGADTVRGGFGHDTIFGGAGNDDIDGEEGQDVIHGGDGSDKLAGGYGEDILFGGESSAGSSGDNFNGGVGVDVCKGAPSGPGTPPRISCEFTEVRTPGGGGNNGPQ